MEKQAKETGAVAVDPCPMPQVEVVEPRRIVQRAVEPPIRAKREQVLKAAYDAKLEQIEDVKLQFASMDLDKWSKIVARLDRERDVKVDATINAMGIFTLFPVAVQEGE